MDDQEQPLVPPPPQIAPRPPSTPARPIFGGGSPSFRRRQQQQQQRLNNGAGSSCSLLSSSVAQHVESTSASPDNNNNDNNNGRDPAVAADAAQMGAVPHLASAGRSNSFIVASNRNSNNFMDVTANFSSLIDLLDHQAVSDNDDEEDSPTTPIKPAAPQQQAKQDSPVKRSTSSNNNNSASSSSAPPPPPPQPVFDILASVRCVVCLDVYDQPVALPACSHHVCKSHILDLAAFHERNDAELCPNGVAVADFFYVRCPKCRAESEIRGGSSKLKVNAEMQALVHAVVQLSSQQQQQQQQAMKATNSATKPTAAPTTTNSPRRPTSAPRMRRRSHSGMSNASSSEHNENDNSNNDKNNNSLSRCSSTSRRRVTFDLPEADRSDNNDHDDDDVDGDSRSNTSSRSGKDDDDSKSSPRRRNQASPQRAVKNEEQSSHSKKVPLQTLEQRLAEQRRKAAEEHAKQIQLKVEEFKRKRNAEIEARRREEEEARRRQEEQTQGQDDDGEDDDDEGVDQNYVDTTTIPPLPPLTKHYRARSEQEDADDKIAAHLEKLREEQQRLKARRREQRENEVRASIEDWLRKAEETKQIIASARGDGGAVLVTAASSTPQQRTRDEMRELAEQRMLEQLPHIGAGMRPDPSLSTSDLLRDPSERDNKSKQQQPDVEVELAMLQQERLMLREKEDKLTKAEMAELAELRARNLITQFRRQHNLNSARGLRPGWNNGTDARRQVSIVDQPLPPPISYVPKMLKTVPIA